MKCHDCRLKLVSRKNVCGVCGIRAIYNVEGETVGIRCREHSEPGMLNVITPKCIGCKKIVPYYGNNGDKVAKYCVSCKEPEMVNIRSQMCITCHKTAATFNKKDEKKPLYCVSCKMDDMINVITKRCVVCHKTTPVFAHPGQTSPTHCSSCKEDTMVDIKSKRCKTCKKTRAAFNYPGKTAEFCGSCKQQDMINVKQKMCESCLVTVPVFNYSGEKEARYCSSCKLDGMVDIKNRKCEGCQQTVPIYGYPNKTSYPVRCVSCKAPDMVNMRTRRCKTCNKPYPTFGFPDTKTPIYCSTCKLDDMVDVVHERCQHPFCRHRASFAQPGVFPQFCATHKQPGMMLNPRRRCQGAENDECKEFATHGISQPLHCEAHALPDEYHLAERECSRCGKTDVLNKSGICVNFCSLEEKDQLMKKRVKKQEEYIRTLLADQIDIKTHVIQTWEDEIIDSTCTKRRPDFVYHCGTFVVIVEVDEGQHKSYTNCGPTPEEKKRGENRRMVEVSQIFQGLPVVWIRYNPDDFKGSSNKSAKIPPQKRQEILVQWIKKAIRMTWPSGIHVKYLFYDGYDATDATFHILTHDEM